MTDKAENLSANLYAFTVSFNLFLPVYNFSRSELHAKAYGVKGLQYFHRKEVKKIGEIDQMIKAEKMFLVTLTERTEVKK